MIDFDPNIPIYWQIIEHIKQKVINREIQPGEMVPSVRTLALELSVTTNTVQRSYTELVRDGILVPVRGLGYKVTTEKRKLTKLRNNSIDEKVDKLLKDMKKMGIQKDEVKAIINEHLDQFEDEDF